MTSTPSAEREWLSWLAAQREPLPALREFARHYHYFSLRQVIAFTGLFRRISPSDRESLASLGDVLYEELGGGKPEQVHSILFEKFAAETGVDVRMLPLRDDEVAPGVRAYVEALHDAFDGPSPVAACAAYVFLESSAVETYEPLLATLTTLNIRKEALDFFVRHARVEPDHKAAAERLARRYVTAESQREYDETIANLAAQWEGFWRSIAEVTKAA